MTTWATFKTNLTLVLDDTDRAAPTWSDAELLMYMNYALAAISDHTAQEKEATEVLAAASTSKALPADCLALGPVRTRYQNIDKLLTPKRREAGKAWASPSSLSGLAVPDHYYQWNGTLYFLAPIPSGVTLTVGYYAYWTALAADADLLGVPRWMEEALLWAVLMRCMSKPGVQASQIRTWNTCQDSGDPEDSPALIFAEYCRKQYERMLANHPTQDRTGWESK